MNFIFSLIIVVLVGACTSIDTFPPYQAERSRSEYTVEGKNGMISTSHPLASKAGIDMLKQGGNAMDAAAAVSFMISVVRPQSTGIGGGGFMLYHDAASSLTKVYDFRERAPARATQKMYLDRRGRPTDFMYKGKRVKNSSVNGHLSVGTPGLVAGVIKSHSQYGKLPLATVIQPAIDVATNGFRVYRRLAEAIVLKKNILKNFEDSRRLFMPAGKPLKIGDTLIQKDLGWTLTQIKKYGVKGFYDGEVARRLIAEMKRGKGIMTKRDLSDYKVKMRQPVNGTYRSHRIVSMPPPSSGGAHIVQILNVLENHDFSKTKHNSKESVHLITEAMRRAFADRAKYLGDPDFVQVPIKGITSKAYGKSLYKKIKQQHATSSKVIAAGNPLPYESKSTTHFSVVDRFGNAVSSTQTINYLFGSCVVAKGTGIVLNDEMDDFSKKPGVPNIFGLVGSKANAIAAKKTMLSSMSPTLVFDKKGDLEMVLGSPGGPKIITATLQTIINSIDFKMDLPDAVHAYRIHHQWLPDLLQYEKNGLSAETKGELKKMGHVLKEVSSMGSVQAIARTENGWIGVSDTRREGAPRGY